MDIMTQERLNDDCWKTTMVALEIVMNEAEIQTETKNSNLERLLGEFNTKYEEGDSRLSEETANYFLRQIEENSTVLESLTKKNGSIGFDSGIIHDLDPLRSAAKLFNDDAEEFEGFTEYPESHDLEHTCMEALQLVLNRESTLPMLKQKNYFLVEELRVRVLRKMLRWSFTYEFNPAIVLNQAVGWSQRLGDLVRNHSQLPSYLKAKNQLLRKSIRETTEMLQNKSLSTVDFEANVAYFEDKLVVSSVRYCPEELIQIEPGLVKENLYLSNKLEGCILQMRAAHFKERVDGLPSSVDVVNTWHQNRDDRGLENGLVIENAGMNDPLWQDAHENPDIHGVDQAFGVGFGGPLAVRQDAGENFLGLTAPVNNIQDQNNAIGQLNHGAQSPVNHDPEENIHGWNSIVDYGNHLESSINRDAENNIDGWEAHSGDNLQPRNLEQNAVGQNGVVNWNGLVQYNEENAIPTQGVYQSLNGNALTWNNIQSMSSVEESNPNNRDEILGGSENDDLEWNPALQGLENLIG